MAKEELKKPIIDEIKSKIDGANGIVVADYRGLTVEEDTKLRKILRENNIIYKVYKNTYIKRATEGTSFEKINQVLEGPTSIAISKDDATSPARLLAEFAKTAPSLELKAGMVEGEYYDKDGIMEIAKIPSRNVLISRLLGSFKSPITNFARVLNQIATKSE
ncbi:MAG: 50S ribosomal protein L10 [Eubacteriales bacterium]|nr:50S ribosomal protein L10 [Eubacteriales bacterium]